MVWEEFRVQILHPNMQATLVTLSEKDIHDEAMPAQMLCMLASDVGEPKHSQAETVLPCLWINRKPKFVF